MASGLSRRTSSCNRRLRTRARATTRRRQAPALMPPTRHSRQPFAPPVAARFTRMPKKRRQSWRVGRAKRRLRGEQTNLGDRPAATALTVGGPFYFGPAPLGPFNACAETAAADATGAPAQHGRRRVSPAPAKARRSPIAGGGL